MQPLQRTDDFLEPRAHRCDGLCTVNHAESARIGGGTGKVGGANTMMEWRFLALEFIQRSM